MAGVQCSFERVEKKFVLTHAQAEALMRDLTAGHMAVVPFWEGSIPSAICIMTPMIMR